MGEGLLVELAVGVVVGDGETGGAEDVAGSPAVELIDGSALQAVTSTRALRAAVSSRRARRMASRFGIPKRYTISGVSQVEQFEPEAERVVRVLRDQIIEGSRPQGSRLVERDLAAEMGVSRIPVRDAIHRLAAEGLVIPRPRTWAVVRTFTAADVEELIEVRSALEVLAFRLATERRTADQLGELGAVLAAEERAVAEGDVRTARTFGADFHELVVTMAGNRLLSELFAGTRSRMRWLLAQHNQPAPMAAEHAALYRAVADGDAERAVALAEAHLETSRRAALAERE